MTPDSYRKLGDAIRRAVADAGLSQAELGAHVAHIDGADNPYPQSTVSTWIAGTGLSPERVFAIERALHLPGGTLSQIVGYVPTGTNISTVPDAIDADPELTVEAKEVLIGAYETARARERVRRAKRSN